MLYVKDLFAIFPFIYMTQEEESASLSANVRVVRRSTEWGSLLSPQPNHLGLHRQWDPPVKSSPLK